MTLCMDRYRSDREITSAQQGHSQHCGASLRTWAGLRDKALVLVGFGGAFRRSELARIEVSDLTFNKDGVVVDLRVSKTDQEGAGRKVGLPLALKPKHLSRAAIWLRAAKNKQGPVFRRVDRSKPLSRRRGLHKDSIGKLLKRTATRARMKTGSQPNT